MNEDKATRYHRLKRRVSLLSLAWSTLLLVGLLLTGASAALREAARAIAPPGALAPGIEIAAYVVALFLFNEAGTLPLAFYGGHVLEHRYGLSRESLRRWTADQAKAGAIGLVLAVGAAEVVYGALHLWPDRWWIAAGLAFAAVIVVLANLAPVLLLPLFYRFRPLEREALRQRLLALAGRAGTRVVGVYEWSLGERTRRANAALTGLGRTRRILVSDTLLAEYSDDEIEVILAHELAHHVHADIWKGIAFESVLILAGFDLAHVALRALAPALGLQGPADIAGLPLLLLAAGGLGLLLVPAANALSRRHERQADRYALELTGNRAAFVSAMRRLATQNLAEDAPSGLVRALFYTHPPIRERIAMAEGGKGSM
ncbi:MAG TPA: M48 family metallopeptidase [Vicinamibacterales bacterium]|nr:M48 family metallopeptidase [Vicinamibacterales bacterium]